MPFIDEKIKLFYKEHPDEVGGEPPYTTGWNNSND